MLNILIDCDPGIDDALALLFCLNRTDVNIVGITTGAGNVSARQGAANTLALLKLAGREDIPVCAGFEQPMQGQCENYPDWIHGKNGLGNVCLPESQQKPITAPVTEFIYRKACEFEGKLLLVTLGRMTNLAHTLTAHPDLPEKVHRVVAMGGTLHAHGNVTPVCEANIWGDPEAADIVVQQDWDLTMVGLDVTLQTHLCLDDIRRLKRFCRKNALAQVNFIEKALHYYTNGNRTQSFTMEYSPLHDPLAMIVAIDPSVVTLQKCVTRIECHGTYARGMVVTDTREKPIQGSFVSHCIKVDSRKALNILFSAFQ
ncbi:MAG: nucleoside hydrolase [Lachnospiraceae bacterium]|nr:nucleoside hydrolase [Lachnospiraceae bacterium]MDY5741649.1 nucleoside hydrolase [Lachnospiraceae bacterium]